MTPIDRHGLELTPVGILYKELHVPPDAFFRMKHSIVQAVRSRIARSEDSMIEAAYEAMLLANEEATGVLTS